MASVLLEQNSVPFRRACFLLCTEVSTISNPVLLTNASHFHYLPGPASIWFSLSIILCPSARRHDSLDSSLWFWALERTWNLGAGCSQFPVYWGSSVTLTLGFFFSWGEKSGWEWGMGMIEEQADRQKIEECGVLISSKWCLCFRVCVRKSLLLISRRSMKGMCSFRVIDALIGYITLAHTSSLSLSLSTF